MLKVLCYIDVGSNQASNQGGARDNNNKQPEPDIASESRQTRFIVRENEVSDKLHLLLLCQTDTGATPPLLATETAWHATCHICLINAI